jgi:hypothetical protein
MRNNLDDPKASEEEAPKTPSSSRQQASTPTTLPRSPTRFGKAVSVTFYTGCRHSVEEALNRFSRLPPTCTFRNVAGLCPNCEARLSGRAGLLTALDPGSQLSIPLVYSNTSLVSSPLALSPLSQH